MSFLTGRRVIGASLIFLLIWLCPAIAQASAQTITVYSPGVMTAGSSSPMCVLVQNGTVPVSGASVVVNVTGPGSVTPGIAVTNSSGYASFTLNAQATAGNLTLLAQTGFAQATSYVQVLPVSGVPAALQMLTPPGLLTADGYSTYFVQARAADRNGTGCSGWPVNFTVDGTRSIVTADVNGVATLSVGPTVSGHTYNVTAEAGGHTANVPVRFMEANLYLLNYPASVPAGQNVTITALLLDDLTPAPGILLNFTVYSPGSLAAPASFAALTDANGEVNFTFRTSPSTGLDTVIVGNQSLGGDLAYASVRGLGGQVSQIVLASDPASPVPADGVTDYTLKIWAKDSGGNPVKGESLNVVRDNDENYTVTTNTNGYAEIDVGPSWYVGTVHFDACDDNGATGNITLSYVAGPPVAIVLKANPAVIASSDVAQPQGMGDVHGTQVIAQVTDQWYHPLPGYNVSVTSLSSLGNITGPASGVTDESGEFDTWFELGNAANGTGTVSVRAASGNLSSAYTITYTNNSFLSVNTSLTPQTVSVNGTINVDISITGLGWNSRPQPVDMMLITDNSGSMDWYSTMVYPTSGTALTGTLPQTSKLYLIATYSNTQYSSLQFMFSCPYTNYANGSYYSGMIVTDPSGYNTTGTNSQNENTVQYASAAKGVYKIYGKYTHSAAGGAPSYYFSVLTLPLRLGSNLDNNTAAKLAAGQLANNMTYLDQMGLVAFNTTGYLCAPLKIVNGTNKSGLMNAINRMNANGGTSLYLGIQKAETEFAKDGRSGVKRVAILLTDGYSQTPAQDITEAYKAKSAGITIYTIGIGMADDASLSSLANITGGQYYRVASDLELSDRYQQIFKNVSDVIANSSSMNIVSTRSVINGTMVNDTEYVPGSAVVTFTNFTTAHVEPAITCSGTDYTLSWNPGAINLNQVWDVKYQLTAIHGGHITPIASSSYVTYTKSDGTIGTANFTGSSLFCQDSVGGQISRTSPSLRVHITSPANGAVADQLRMSVDWNVAYTGSDNYTQVISVIPENSGESADIAKGFGGDQNTTGSFSYNWNIERMPTGNYTIQVYVTDGTYDAIDQVNMTIPYHSGQIVLK